LKPVLFVTGEVPAYRVGGLRLLHERELIELATFGGSALHAGPAHPGELPLPHRRVRPRELFALAASGGYRAVIVPTGGRLAPVASWLGARRGGTPVILWASLWAHPRTATHAFTYLPLRRLYSSADAVVTYGEHVSAYVRARGARNVHVARQAVDNDFWRIMREPPAAGPARFVFVGRPDRAKGLEVLLRAWRQTRLAAEGAELALVGIAPSDLPPGVKALGRRSPEELRELYSRADVLVVPSIATRNFREPWGLVVNEAMNAGLAVVTSDAVGAAAGGLVRDGENGLVFPAGDAGALSGALERLARDASLRAELGEAGAYAVAAYDYDAWARGFSGALASLGLSRGRW
jgi:glycosyltransferase involved in cell wall biosynthesis